MKNSIQFNFPNSEFNQWLLIWIGNPIMHNKLLSCTLYFVEVEELTDSQLTADGNNNYHTEFQKIVPLHFINLLHQWNIYDKSGNLIKLAKSYSRKSFNLPIDKKAFDNTIGAIELKEVKEYFSKSRSPLLKIENFHQSFFLIKEMTFNGEPHFFLIPHFALFQYFYNISTKVSEQLFYYRIKEIFSRDDITLNEEKETLLVKYDNRRLSKYEVTSLLKRLAFGIDTGYANLRYIGSNILNSLMNNETPILKVNSMLNSNYTLRIKGKSLGNNLTLVYDILQHNPKNNKSIFDKIELIEKFPVIHKGKPQSHNDSDIPDGVKIQNHKPTNAPIRVNEDVGPGGDNEETIQYENDVFDLDIKSETITEPEESEEGKPIETVIEENFDGVNPNNNGNDVDEDNLYMNFLVHFDIFRRSEYILAITNALSSYLDRHRYIKLSEEVFDEIGFTKEYHSKYYDIIILEMEKESSFYYLIEFTFGNTQLISLFDSRNIISNYELNLMIDAFVKRYNNYLHHNRIAKLYLEDEITNQRYLESDGNDNSRFKMFIPIEHQHIGMRDFEYLIDHTKKKIISRINADLRNRQQA